MNMNIFNLFEAEFKSIVEMMKVEEILPADVDTGRVVFELPRDASHGDLACNAAMVLAKQVGAKPRDLAAQPVLAVEQVLEGEVLRVEPAVALGELLPRRVERRVRRAARFLRRRDGARSRARAREGGDADGGGSS